MSDSDGTYKVLILVGMILSGTAGLFLHGSGIFILLNVQRFKWNERILLMALSTIEMFLILTNCFTITTMLYPLDELAQDLVITVQYYASISWAGIQILLTVNRFLEIYLHLKYPVIITKARMNIAVTLVSLTGVTATAVALGLRAANGVNMLRIAHLYMWPPIFICIIIISTFVFSYIYIKLHKDEVSNFRSLNILERCSKFIPTWIIITFVLCFLIPETVITIKFYYGDTPRYNSLLLAFLALVFNIGFLVDAIIYIFLNKYLRKRFQSILRSANPCVKKIIGQPPMHNLSVATVTTNI